MQSRLLLSSLLLSLSAYSVAVQAADAKADKRIIERGRALAVIGGCNDCHTAGYAESGGRIPEADWLTGSAVGFQGPWGTSYAVNLRRYVQSLTEAQWLARVRQPMRPPMPWFNLRDSSTADLVALYRYMRSLGPAGEATPAAAAPGAAVSTPYFDFVPKNLPRQANARP